MMNLTVPHHVSPQHWNVVSEIIIFRTFFFLTKKKHIKLTLLSHINRISQVVFTTSHVIVSHFWWIVGWSYHIKSTENRQSHIKIWYSQPCFCFFLDDSHVKSHKKSAKSPEHLQPIGFLDYDHYIPLLLLFLEV